MAASTISGAHINPAVTIGLAAIGKFSWLYVPGYIAGQMVGAFLGALIVWLAYFPHWGITEDKELIRGVFCTIPAVRRPGWNMVTEMIGTFVLVLGVLAIPSVKNLVPASGFGTGFGPFLVGVIVWSIGLSLGGSTGYAINPARDFGHGNRVSNPGRWKRETTAAPTLQPLESPTSEKRRSCGTGPMESLFVSPLSGRTDGRQTPATG